MNIISNNENISFNSNSNQIEIQDVNSAIYIKNNPKGLSFKTPQVTITGGKVNDILVNGESVLDEQGKANIIIPEIPDTSEFIKNTVDNLVNYYLKSETYSKEEIDELAKSLTEIGYATEQWVKDQNYMPIEDFYEYVNYVFYTKEEIDKKIEELPTGGTEYKADDNIIIEDETIKGYTNTGYKVSDKDINLQSISESGTTGTNKMVYIEDKEITVIYDGSNKIRRSENGIDFEIISLPYACKSMIYNKNSERVFGLANGYFLISKDYGVTWETKQSTFASSSSYISLAQGHVKGFIAVNKSNKRMTPLDENCTQTGSYITSTIIPEFVTQFEAYKHIWCNSSGTFKYGAGSQEGVFASLSGVTVNMLKTINGRQYIGLKNSNKLYTIKNLSGVSNNEWIPYTLPNTCTVNDIIFNPYDETYYIFTNINTYYKTKDFISFDSVDRNSLKGIQGYFTLMGIQMTTTDHNRLLLAPTRTKIENKLQEHDRDLNKSLWVGNGLELTEEGKVNVKSINDMINVYEGGISLGQVDEYHLTEDIVESLYVAKAELNVGFDPYEMDSWFWEFGIPSEEQYKATKLIFSKAGSFYEQLTWEEEIFVEQYDYGYIFCDQNMTVFKYVKLGNLAWVFNKGE